MDDFMYDAKLITAITLPSNVATFPKHKQRWIQFKKIKNSVYLFIALG